MAKLGEGLNPLQIMDRMEDFARHLPHEGVNSYILEGPIRRDERIVDVVAGLFPAFGLDIRSTSTMITSNPNIGPKDALYYNSRILHMELSQRIKDLGIRDNEATRKRMTKICLKNGWPIVMFTFGKYRDTDISFVQLNTIAGMSPETALSEFKQKSRDVLIAFQ